MTEPKSCPRCFAPLRPSESPEGLCPKCLLAVAMGEDGLIRSATGAPVPAPPSIEELTPHFPQLEILSLIGRGGAGAVYRAVQRDLGRTVALKVLLLDPELDPTFGERFAREARAMASLTHPGIAAVHDAGRSGPYWYLILEFIDGQNLRQVIQGRDLAASAALDVVRQICSALEYAHGEGVVHRDIKPENVLVDRHGRVKLVDFGLAKLLRPQVPGATLTHSSQAMGTWHYMAPEQIRRPMEVDHRADIYSLGVVLYELLTGEVPQGRYAPASQRAHTDRRIDSIVDRALEQDPDRRYQRVSGVREDVEKVGTQPEGTPPQDPKRDRAARRAEFRSRVQLHGSRGHPLMACGCLMLFFIVLMWLGVLLLGGTPVPESGFVAVKRTTPASPGASHLLQALDVPEDTRPAVVAAAERAWQRYTHSELEHTRVYRITDPEGTWFQLEVSSFEPALRRLAASLIAEIGPQVGMSSPDPLLTSQVFPSGFLPRVLIGREGDEEGGLRVVTQGDYVRVFGRGDLRSQLESTWTLEDSDRRQLPWTLAELGLDARTPVAELDALLAAHQAYVKVEAEAIIRVARENGILYVILPFPEQRQAILDELNRSRSIFSRGERVAKFLLPFGGGRFAATVLHLSTAEGERIEYQRAHPLVDSSVPGWVRRFLARAEQEPGVVFPLTPWEVGLDSALGADFERATYYSLVLAYGDYLTLEAEHSSALPSAQAQATGEVSDFPGWKAVPVPVDRVGAVQTRVSAFPEQRDALVRRLTEALGESSVGSLADRLLPFGARDETVHAGTWGGHSYLIAVDSEGNRRTVWGGTRDRRFERFFRGEEQPLAGHWLSAESAVFDAGLEPVFPSAGAELLLSGLDPQVATSPKAVKWARLAWMTYVVALRRSILTTTWITEEGPYVQVDLKAFPEGLASLHHMLSAQVEDVPDLAELGLPGSADSAQLRITEQDGLQVWAGAGCEQYPIFAAITEQRLDTVDWQARLLEARFMNFEVVNAAWGKPDLAPPASFSRTVIDIYEHYVAREAQGLTFRLHPGLANTMEILVGPVQLDEPVAAELNPGAWLPFLDTGGSVLVTWQGEQASINGLFIDGQAAPHPAVGLERFLLPDLVERAQLWCDPADLGLDTDIGPATVWTVGRARWAYLGWETDSRRRINPPLPLVPRPNDLPRQLRLEGPVWHVASFQGFRQELLARLRMDLETLGNQPPEVGQLGRALAPLGENPVDLVLEEAGDHLKVLIQTPGTGEPPVSVYSGPRASWRWRHLIE
jgi:tRNA A-37 threonylcarbamoyl transferase component Bud32